MSSLPWTADQSAIGVDLYRSDDYDPAGRIPLSPLLRKVFEAVLGESLEGARFMLYFHAVEDLQQLSEPSVVNLRASHGFVNVQISRDGNVIYQHPHSVREVVGRPLQMFLAKHDPQEQHWGFGISGPGLEKVGLKRPAPENVGAIEVATGGRQQPRIFHLEAMPDEPFPKAEITDFGVTNVDSAESLIDRVVLAPEVHEGLLRTMEFSKDVEAGGFLVGRVFDDGQRPGRHLIEIVEAIPAERTGASLLQFTFTGESFLRINDAVERRGPDQRLVGWYHTHLFAATDNLGLSSIDVDLHSRTFLRPWQVAGLVNITGSTRELRFYGWDGSKMHQLPFWLGTS